MKKMLFLLLPIILVLAMISDLRNSDLSAITIKNSFNNLNFIQLEFKEINFEWTDYSTIELASDIQFGGSKDFWDSAMSGESSWQYGWRKTKETISNIWNTIKKSTYDLVLNIRDWLEQIYHIFYNISYFIYWIVGNSSIAIGWFVGMVY